MGGQGPSRWLIKNGLAASGAHLEGLGLLRSKRSPDGCKRPKVRKPRSWDPEDYETEAGKAQNDTDATFTKKGNKTYFGYKNHVSVDERFGFVRRYGVSETSLHESQVFEGLTQATRAPTCM